MSFCLFPRAENYINLPLNHFLAKSLEIGGQLSNILLCHCGVTPEMTQDEKQHYVVVRGGISGGGRLTPRGHL